MARRCGQPHAATVIADGAAALGALTVGGALGVTGHLTMGVGGQIRADDGTALLPGITWASDTDLGWRRHTADGVTLNGGGGGTILVATTNSVSFARNTFISAGFDLTVGAGGQLVLDAGTLAEPSLTTLGDLNTGVYFPAAGHLRTVGDGAYAANFSAGLSGFNGSIQANQILFTERADTTPVANVVALYARDATGLTQLTVRSQDGLNTNLHTSTT